MNKISLATKNSDRNRGFTMVEVLIVVAIFGAMVVVLAQFLFGFNLSFAYIQARIEVSSSAGVVINEATSMARQANRIIGSRMFDGTTRTSSANALVLELPAIDNSGEMIGGKYDYVAFYTDGTGAYKIVEVDIDSARNPSFRKLSDSIHSLVFTYDDPDPAQAQKINISVETRQLIRDQTLQSILNQQIYLRNK